MSEQNERDIEQIEQAWLTALIIWVVVLGVVFGALVALMLSVRIAG